MSVPTDSKVKTYCNTEISRLNYAAFVLAVYASQILSPRPMQDSLPVICHALLDGMLDFNVMVSIRSLRKVSSYNPPFTSFVSQAICSLSIKPSPQILIADINQAVREPAQNCGYGENQGKVNLVLLSDKNNINQNAQNAKTKNQ